eukprot:comp23396_c0_seq1/m.38786 comp23396_c0_seq1/g.38786  ORF comp23396_c0_seq1/g.38786 comp23396_c0_seq1/m.38786 type:complete len:391 (-) comp23396_c0_seq1:735-1907(-)
MTTFHRAGQRRQRQSSCPEMFVGQLAQLQGQFNALQRDTEQAQDGGGFLQGGLADDDQVMRDISLLAEAINIIPSGPPYSQMPHQPPPQQQGAGRGALSSHSVDDHFARSLAKFGGRDDASNPGTPKMSQMRSNPYPRNRVRRTSSLPQMYNDQMAAIESALAGAQWEDQRQAGPQQRPEDDRGARPLRERKLPASFFSPKPAGPSSPAASQVGPDVLSLLQPQPSALSSSLHQLKHRVDALQEEDGPGFMQRPRHSQGLGVRHSIGGMPSKQGLSNRYAAIGGQYQGDMEGALYGARPKSAGQPGMELDMQGMALGRDLGPRRDQQRGQGGPQRGAGMGGQMHEAVGSDLNINAAELEALLAAGGIDIMSLASELLQTQPGSMPMSPMS